jgi:hypothetical protein
MGPSRDAPASMVVATKQLSGSALITQQEAEIYLRAGILLWVVNYVVAGRTDELDAEAIRK